MNSIFFFLFTRSASARHIEQMRGGPEGGKKLHGVIRIMIFCRLEEGGDYTIKTLGDQIMYIMSPTLTGKKKKMLEWKTWEQ